ncbi:helix-turn-helix domain-containing protein [Thalassovita autumnalis]
MSPPTIYRLANKGKLKIHKLEGTSLIKVSELTDLIESSAA